MKRSIIIVLIVILIPIILLSSCTNTGESQRNKEDPDEKNQSEAVMTESEKQAMINNRAILYALCDKELLSKRIADYCYECFRSNDVSSMAISEADMIHKTWLDNLWKKHRKYYINTIMENGDRYCFMFEGNEVWAIKKDGPEGDIIMTLQE